MKRLFWLSLILALNSFPVTLVLMAGSAASITLSGVVLPRVQTIMVAQTQEATVGTDPKSSRPVAVVRCDLTLNTKVTVDSGTAHEVLRGTLTGQTMVYVVNRPPDADKLLVTIVSE